MKVKDFIKKLEELNPEDHIYFEVLSEDFGGEMGTFPLSITRIYRCEEGGVSIEFEDN